jgi:transcriptional regulator GlxA family with amidase domain
MGTQKKKCISNALDIVEELETVHITVTEWAANMGYSRAHFTRRFTHTYGRNPKDILRDIRIKGVVEEIEKNPRAKAFEIAVNTGFIDEKALHKFLNYHYRTSLKELKNNTLKKHKLDTRIILNS